MKNNLYFLERYVKCGAMPVYLVFYRDNRGRKAHCAMLCSVKKLRGLLQQRKGFDKPETYGRVIYKGFENEPSEFLRQIIKARYDFDLNHAAGMENRLM